MTQVLDPKAVNGTTIRDREVINRVIAELIGYRFEFAFNSIGQDVLEEGDGIGAIYHVFDPQGKPILYQHSTTITDNWAHHDLYRTYPDYLGDLNAAYTLLKDMRFQMRFEPGVTEKPEVKLLDGNWFVATDFSPTALAAAICRAFLTARGVQTIQPETVDGA